MGFIGNDDLETFKIFCQNISEQDKKILKKIYYIICFISLLYIIFLIGISIKIFI